MNVAHLFARSAMRAGDRPALAHGEAVVATYAELVGQAARLAGGLRQELGLAPGDRVAHPLFDRR